MKRKGKIHIGTSGWHYKHWVGPFYPEDTKPADFMDFYKQFFSTVELNNSFYHLPPKEIFAQWRKQTPKDFIFSVKASRYITHNKKLKESKESVDLFLNNAGGLKEKLGPILFQLPPSWRFNGERFEVFLKSLPRGYRFTFEFRNPTWYNEKTIALLKKYKAAFCIYILAEHFSPIEVTADFIYIRLHGPGGKYQGSYDDKSLKEWAKRIKTWSEEGKDIYCYFDNDQEGYAALNSKRLLELI